MLLKKLEKHDKLEQLCSNIIILEAHKKFYLKTLA